MKTNSILKTILLLFIVVAISSCVKDDDFDTPSIDVVDNDISNALFSTVKNSLIQGFPNSGPTPSTLIYTFADDETAIIAAYVVGDDTTGNFYKKLIVQDSPENPTGGLEIRINQGALHAKYNVGRKIYIKLAGLSVAYYDGSQGSAPDYPNQSIPDSSTPGVYKLGIRGEDFNLDRISLENYENYIVRSSNSETIVPNVISTNDIDDAHMNTYVQFNDMQIDLDDIGKSFAGEEDDSFDAERKLLSCDTEYSFGLMTSTFSNFKNLTIPSDKGTVIGVLAKNFRESSPVIVLNDYTDINFTDTDRCDPVLLDCGTAAVHGANNLLTENFDAGLPATWTNYTEEGTQTWNTFSGSSALSGNSVRMGSYQSGDASSIAWLISPAINMDAQTGETLEFQTSNSFSDGSELKLMFSTDWDGTEAGVASANWGIIPAADIVEDSEYYQNWVSSNIVDLSCAEGTSFYIAFKYIGSGDSGSDGTYELDDIQIKY